MNHEEHLKLHKLHAKTVFEASINLNPPRWYDRFLFWKKRKPTMKTLVEIQRELNAHQSAHIDLSR